MSKLLIFQTVGDYKFPKICSRQSIEFALKYEPQNSDKFLVTYPKSGTTWTQQIINLIINNGRSGNLSYIENSYLEYSGEILNRNWVIKTHLPFEAIPMNKCAKYLLVFRNPKDCCVSFYYHASKCYPDFKGDFHDYFKLWISGDVPYGDYFEHTLHYWNHRFDYNFEFLVYEQMKDNPTDAVLKIARFLGEEYVDKLKDNQMLVEEVLKKSSIDSMRNDFCVYEYDFYTRKGVVGDWRHHFTKEESDLVDHKIESIFGGTGLDTLWDKYVTLDK